MKLGKQFCATVLAIAVAASFLGAPSPAHAAFQLKLTTASDPVGLTFTDGGTGTILIPSQSYAGYAISILSSITNSPGTPLLGQIFTSNTMLQNLSAIEALMVTISSTNFTLPGAPGSPIDLRSQIGGSSTTGSGTVTFQTFFDNANGLFVTAAGPGVITPGPTMDSINPSFDSPISTSGVRTGAMYSLTQKGTFDITIGTNMNFAASSNVTIQAVPEPSTVGLALIGLVVLPIARAARKLRQARPVA